MNKKFKTGIVSASIVMVVGTAIPWKTQAVDTEIYRNLNNVNQNLLFILDSSPSMDAEVLVDTYDSATTYADQGCGSGNVYYGSPTTGSVPDCADNTVFDIAALKCKGAIDSLAGTSGYHIDYYAVYDDAADVWGTLDFAPGAPPANPHLECRGDFGIHGEANGNTEIYPVDGDVANAWTATDPGNENFWDGKSFVILYDSNYLNWYHGGGSGDLVSKSRLDIVKDVIRTIVGAISDISVGLMRFDTDANLPAGDPNAPNGNGGPVIFPMSDVGSAGFEANFNSSLNNITAANLAGTTALAETLYEAVRYYRGEGVVWGTSANGTASVDSALTSPGGGTYESPIIGNCQENNIFILSDGEPTKDGDSDTTINTLIGGGSACEHSFQSSSCLGALATHIHTNDNSSDFGGDQFIDTYTIGFTVDSSILEAAGNPSTGGEYYVATDETTLLAAVASGVSKVQSDNSSFAAPSTSVNAFDRVSNSNDLYFSVFTPSDNVHWDGNVKLYEFGFIRDGSGNTVDANGDGEDDTGILDANGDRAVDDFGVFLDTARSFWTHSSVGDDGADPALGGAASRIHSFNGSDYNPLTRLGKVLTYTQADEVSPENDLTNAKNHLSEANALLTLDFMNLTGMGLDDDDRLELLTWARGVDVDDEDQDSSFIDGRPIMGAPLHGEPIPVTYQDISAGNDSAQRDIVFIPTNDGFVHAFDNSITSNDSRMELWAFAPPSLLDNLYSLKLNGAASDILYGLDGTMDVWQEDANGDGFTLGNDGSVQADEHTYLYLSQRRGGREYIALDVSDPMIPKFKWIIAGNDSTSNPFHTLGQSWSRPRVSTVLDKDGSALVERKVLIFGGGYDLTHDSKLSRSDDDVGHSIFIVDADDGSLLFRAGGTSDGPDPDLEFSAMNYAIPSDIRVVDISGDGIADRFYVVDLGGQVWRFDINNGSVDELKNRILGGVIADLQLTTSGATPDAANHRRFFYPPDIALIEPEGGNPFMSIAVGSGSRISPKSTTVDDRIYVLKDRFVRTVPRDSAGNIDYSATFNRDFNGDGDFGDANEQVGVLQEDELLDVTDIPNPSGLDVVDDSDKIEQLSRGWFIQLEGAGEKALAPALTADGQVFFTTFNPPGVVNNNALCPAPDVGDSNVYVVDVRDGAPVSQLSALDSAEGPQDEFTPTSEDRLFNLERAGISPGVSIIFPDLPGVTPKAIVGTEVIPITFERPTVRTYWYEDHAL